MRQQPLNRAKLSALAEAATPPTLSRSFSDDTCRAPPGAEYINFLHIAKGSVAELRTQLYIASKLEMIPREKAKDLVQEAKEISAMLQAMIGSVSGSLRKEKN